MPDGGRDQSGSKVKGGEHRKQGGEHAKKIPVMIKLSVTF
ncbi:hypothetical protein B4096_1952 [Heyndrickxia coagulans]|nr:hypothetical protein B4096_1952 [Heyndrickxia coagulans]